MVSVQRLILQWACLALLPVMCARDLKVLLLFCSSVTCRSPGHSLRSDLPSVPAPLGPEEITLPHSNPIPASQVELAKPWIEVRLNTL